MQPTSLKPAAIAQPAQQILTLSGSWTARGIGALERQLESVHIPTKTEASADGTSIEALDLVGAWLLQKQLLRLRDEGSVVTLDGVRPEFAKLLEVVAQHLADQAGQPAVATSDDPYGGVVAANRAVQSVLKQLASYCAEAAGN
jgi:phospholipid/cholesterol/gamma-HCH transport system permease protein